MKIGLLTFAAAAADKTENFYKNGNSPRVMYNFIANNLLTKMNK